MRKHPRNCFQGTLTMPSFTKLQISLDGGLTTGFNPEILLWMQNTATARTFIYSFFFLSLCSGQTSHQEPALSCAAVGEVMSFLRKGEVEIKSGVWSWCWVFPSSRTVKIKWKKKLQSHDRLVTAQTPGLQSLPWSADSLCNCACAYEGYKAAVSVHGSGALTVCISSCESLWTRLLVCQCQMFSRLPPFRFSFILKTELYSHFYSKLEHRQVVCLFTSS